MQLWSNRLARPAMKWPDANLRAARDRCRAGAGQAAPAQVPSVQTAPAPYKGYAPGIVRSFSGGERSPGCRQAAFTIRPPSSQAPPRPHAATWANPAPQQINRARPELPVAHPRAPGRRRDGESRATSRRRPGWRHSGWSWPMPHHSDAEIRCRNRLRCRRRGSQPPAVPAAACPCATRWRRAATRAA